MQQAATLCVALLPSWLPVAHGDSRPVSTCGQVEAAGYALAAAVQLQALTAQQAGSTHAVAALNACAAALKAVDLVDHPTATCLQSWQRPVLQMHAALVVAGAACSEAVLGPVHEACLKRDYAAGAAEYMTTVVSMCLQMLKIAPPGTEPIALRVLSTLTRLDVLRVLRGAAHDAMQGLQGTNMGTTVAWGAAVPIEHQQVRACLLC